MRPVEPLLIICHSFPPNFGIGGRRWAKFAKELARRGHPIHVIRGERAQNAPPSLWIEDVQHPNIIQHTIPVRYPAIMTRWPLTSFWDKLKYHFWIRTLPLLTRGNYYDIGFLSKSPLVGLATKLIKEHGISQVIVTGAPFSLMAHAAALRDHFPTLHLVADFRDAWTWGKDYGFGTIGPARRKHEESLEAKVARNYDKLISPDPSAIKHLLRTYGEPASRYQLIPHTIDPDDVPGRSAMRTTKEFRMIYAGSLYGAAEAERYFSALLDAFDALRRDRPNAYAACRLDLYITGQGTAAYEQSAKDRGADDRIHFHAPLPPSEIYKQVALADLVLSFIPSMNKDILGTKFNEIFYAGCPILHVGEPGVVSKTIRERRMGDSIRLEELVVELPRIISGERPVDIDKEADHSGYLLTNITDRLIKEVLV